MIERMAVPFWRDHDTPWMAKLLRAGRLLVELESSVGAFMPTAFELGYEPGDDGETHLRIIRTDRVPTEILTLIGDVVHNLRSALDCVAYDLACRSNRGQLTEKQERNAQLPVYDSQQKYKKFFRDRRGLFDEAAEDALRSIAPGWRYDPIALLDGKLILTFEQEVKLDKLWDLHQLSIIDKHRRLHVVALWPGDVYWINRDGDGPGWKWGIPPFDTGRLLGTFVGAEPPHRYDLTATLEPRIAEDRLFGGQAVPVIETLLGMHQYIEGWVLPRVWHDY